MIPVEYLLSTAMVVRSFQNPSCRGRRHGYNHQKLSAATEAPFAEGFRFCKAESPRAPARAVGSSWGGKSLPAPALGYL